MKRSDKATAVQRMAEEFGSVSHVFVTDYRGMTANQSVDLRRRIRKTGGTFTVLKNRLAKRAAVGTAVEKVSAHLVGTRGLACHESDPVAMAKVLTEFAKENPQLQLVAAVVDARDVFATEGIKTLATLPGLPELRSQALAVLHAPAVQLLRLLGTPGSQLARVLDGRRKKLDGSED